MYDYTPTPRDDFDGGVIYEDLGLWLNAAHCAGFRVDRPVFCPEVWNATDVDWQPRGCFDQAVSRGTLWLSPDEYAEVQDRIQRDLNSGFDNGCE